ncbi:hypothetical protein FQ330_05785 [Agrococcus sediminis]|uniref:Peptidase C-terminal archaeal/bacterial domain-containing protein n=1 Tax=Agrococcus sediminis TaxID=2599924 RepID=A0A5M8QGU8_9MICO|nr:hypothetical protein [Agrococcus sediminis]KAA6435259.1 hypothetical protein FQ330_05785 [Agrococcus sediminis]
MRHAQVGRVAAASLLVAMPALALTGCFIPSPPPVPRPESLEPIAQGSPDEGDVRTGFIPGDGTAELTLLIDQRAAVVATASSTDDEDLTLRIVGDGADVENDDGYDEAGGFALDTSTRDPLLATVLEPGSYTIEVAEYGGDATGFELQVVTSTDAVGPGEQVALAVEPGRPGVAIATIAEGDEAVSAIADFDAVLWAQMSDSDTTYRDDDSGGDRNPSIQLFGESAQEVVVVAWAFEDGDAGPVTLTVG